MNSNGNSDMVNSIANSDNKITFDSDSYPGEESSSSDDDGFYSKEKFIQLREYCEILISKLKSLSSKNKGLAKKLKNSREDCISLEAK